MKIAIAGFGIEGRANYDYFDRLYPEAELVIVDERQTVDNLPTDAKAILGENAFEKLADFDLVVRTAGLAPRKIKTNGKIWSATNEFFARCPAEIIGVTGTKGKGTTCSLITSILQSAGKKVHLVGNIGTPALEILPDIQPDDTVVYELSSFQLWDLEKSPHIAVVLMIEPDHLDVHADFDEYLAAKQNIVKYQTAEDFVVYYDGNSYSQQIGLSSLGQKVSYVNSLKPEFMEALRLPGEHNLGNAAAAVLAAGLADPDLTDTSVVAGLSNFTGLPHRLKFVTEKSSVKYYDDSIATTPGSVVAAMKSFEEPKVLILGGADKGADYSQMVQEIANSDSIRAVVLIGSNAKKLEQLFSTIGTKLVNLGQVDMLEIVQAAARESKAGDIVILSPAAASFDMFKNYQDRGDQFAQAVEALID